MSIQTLPTVYKGIYRLIFQEDWEAKKMKYQLPNCIVSPFLLVFCCAALSVTEWWPSLLVSPAIYMMETSGGDLRLQPFSFRLRSAVN
jgi:hypothetical protein